ncbi:hypothetical protein CONLIGDRAFT_477905 [Coniochaeta ligniaria NRRL 30616]|uniref:Uncharacterized protein n=1 Tax=Coniochaeta ligniaria NRRL 30616 TaxID=1408157 RepID=A0A1J7IGY7_9PEZI|nr:hypothetical protein CONLIGDRAFT_477905 [Coniochaeta ligniaria NRRL 30616]
MVVGRPELSSARIAMPPPPLPRRSSLGSTSQRPQAVNSNYQNPANASMPPPLVPGSSRESSSQRQQAAASSTAQSQTSSEMGHPRQQAGSSSTRSAGLFRRDNPFLNADGSRAYNPSNPPWRDQGAVRPNLGLSSVEPISTGDNDVLKDYLGKPCLGRCPPLRGSESPGRWTAATVERPRFILANHGRRRPFHTSGKAE